jgi:osmotically-inducible protein OsmY
MKTIKLFVPVVLLLAIGMLVGCRGVSAKSADVSDSIRKALDQAGLKDVAFTQDRDKGIVTLGGQVANQNDKMQAESLAKSFAGTQVVADQIAVIPAGQGKETRAMNSDLDGGIEKNLDAALILNRMHSEVNYSVTNGVVTLSGGVDTDQMRTAAETVASGVPNVLQVVNDLQVTRDRKASSSQ